MRVRSIASLICALLPAAELRPQQHNVLILLADDIGVDKISVYGEGPNPAPTPHIDALAARGVLFRNAWSYPVCSSTRACLQTGRHALRTGVGGLTQPGGPVLGREEVTLPELLDAAGSGYAHAYLGKWHLGNELNGGAAGPNVAGWSHFAGVVSGFRGYFTWPRTVNGVTATSTAYRTTQNVDDALSWLRSAPEPWVCQVAFLSAHDPFHAPPPHLHTQNLQGLNPAANPHPFYAAMVEAMDTEIGRLLTSLGPDVVAATNVVFLADNGTPKEVSEGAFAPAHAKGTPYEGGVNVPLIVAGPGVRGNAREEPALVSAVDVFATVAELCGVEPTVPWVAVDGVSFVPHLEAAGTPPVRSTVYAEFFSVGHGVPFATIRGPTYKLIRWFSPARDELFDLAADPFEQSNLLSGMLTTSQRAAYDALKAEMDALRNPTGSIAGYGTASCTGSGGALRIGWSGTPALGSSYAVTLRGASSTQPAFLLVGASDRSWGPLALPFALSSIGGGPGCSIHASGELTARTTTAASGTATLSVSVPAVATLLGASLFHSWLVFDPAAPNNPLGLTASDAVEAVIGR